MLQNWTKLENFQKKSNCGIKWAKKVKQKLLKATKKGLNI